MPAFSHVLESYRDEVGNFCGFGNGGTGWVAGMGGRWRDKGERWKVWKDVGRYLVKFRIEWNSNGLFCF